jgi:hypothetical protein
VPTKSENGFLFIDVAPGSPTCEPPRHLRPPHPPTYVVVTATAADEMPPCCDATSALLLDENLMPPIPRDDWRMGRQCVSRARRRPATMN